MDEPEYSIYEGEVILSDAHVGAVLQKDERWWPFSFKSEGPIEIWDTEGGYISPSGAYEMAKLKFS